jgi:hypothetical protein
VTLHVSWATAAVSTIRAASTSVGFVLMQTPSGNSLGSLGHHSMDWNNADMSEVTSGNPQARPHPAGPSNLAQKMHAVKDSLVAADKAAEVNIFLFIFILLQNTPIYISSSPRGSGRVYSA